MTRTNEEPLNAPGGALTPAAAAPQVLLVDTDHALLGLLDEWLSCLGCKVVQESSGAAGQRFDLAVVDVPFPRQGGVDLVRRIADRHPATPILALSSTFCAGIGCHGQVARALGVACVLPKPASREALTNAVARLLPPMR
jgi:CheY-like chemotaxis protein